MHEILPNLFIGSELDYENHVRWLPGWMVVHACKEPYHRTALGYTGRAAPKDHPEYLIARRGDRLVLNLVDAPQPEYIPGVIIDSALEFIHTGLQRPAKVLVHCNQGESRSPSIGLLYLARYTALLPTTTLEDAERQYRQLYPEYNPNTGIRGFLSLNWSQYMAQKK